MSFPRMLAAGVCALSISACSPAAPSFPARAVPGHLSVIADPVPVPGFRPPPVDLGGPGDVERRRLPPVRAGASPGREARPNGPLPSPTAAQAPEGWTPHVPNRTGARLPEPDSVRPYSSRPERFREQNRKGATPAAGGLRERRPYVRSEWAANRPEPFDRGGFDAMAIAAARDGGSSFEDAAGRVYHARTNGREGGCVVVEVALTSADGLALRSRGSAYVCE